MSAAVAAPALRGPDPERFRVKVHGARWYRDDLPADGRWSPTPDAVPSVTTIKKAWSKPFRKKAPSGLVVSLDAYWAGEYVARNLDKLAGFDPDDVVTQVATAPDIALAKAGARGDAVHSIMEAYAAGVAPAVDLLDEDAKPYVDACRAFVAEWRPEFLMSEVVTFNRSVGFAGTCDSVARLPGLGLTVVDYKSRGEKHGAYAEEACQLGGYASADYFVVDGPSGPERIEPPDFESAAIVSLCPDGTYEVWPVDLDEAKRAFLGLFETWRIRREGESLGRRAVLKPLPKPAAEEGRDLKADRPGDEGGEGRAEEGGRPEEVEKPQDPAGNEEAGKGGDREDDRPSSDEGRWRQHFADRIAVIKGHLEATSGGLLPLPWPAGVPMLKSGRPIDEAGREAVERWCDEVERVLGLPFFPPLDDPRPAVGAPLAIEPERRVVPDYDAEARQWAERGKALLALLDDDDLAHECAAVAGVEAVRMTRERFLSLEAVVTQVSAPAGILTARWVKGAVEVGAVDDIEKALIAAMPTRPGTTKSQATKGEALARGRYVAKKLGRKPPRSYLDLCADLLLAACVAAGHGATDSDIHPPST